MSVQEKTQETQDTTSQQAPSRPIEHDKITPGPNRGTRERWVILIAALIALGAVTVLVGQVVGRGSNSDTPAPNSDGQLVSDESGDVAETNRFEVLRDQSEPVSDESAEVAETNRFEVLRDQSGPVSDESAEVAETNRFEVLRDQSGPVSDESAEVAETNRFEVLRDQSS